MILYIYSKCSTCKKALVYLKERNIHVEIREITLNPPSVSDLKKMLKFQNGNLKKLFNTSGNLYKELKLSQKLETMSEDEALDLLSTHGMLVKRPFLLGKDFGVTGFHEESWSKILQKS